MKNALDDMLYNFDIFIGPLKGHLILYIICVFLIGLSKKKYFSQIFFPMLLFIGITLNPIIYKIIGERFLSGVYWRVFWLFPIALTIAIVASEMISAQNKCWKKIFLMVAMAGIIIYTGEPVISRANYDFPKNEYQLADSTIQVCDAILADTNGRMTRAIVPYELLTQVRQYTSYIGLLYGRNVDGFISDIDGHELWAYDIMSSEEVDLDSLRIIALYKEVEYIVFDSTINMVSEDISVDGYKYIATVDQYIIYKVF